MLFFSSDEPGPPPPPTPTHVDRTSIHLTWSPPDDDGGSEVTGYIIEKRDKSRNKWTKVNKEPIPETSFTVTGLTEEAIYDFRVSAVNKAGEGPPSLPSDTLKAKLPFGELLMLPSAILHFQRLNEFHQSIL